MKAVITRRPLPSSLEVLKPMGHRYYDARRGRQTVVGPLRLRSSKPVARDLGANVRNGGAVISARSHAYISKPKPYRRRQVQKAVSLVMKDGEPTVLLSHRLALPDRACIVKHAGKTAVMSLPSLSSPCSHSAHNEPATPKADAMSDSLPPLPARHEVDCTRVGHFPKRS